MALLSNVPTLSYVRWQNLLITYQGTTYQISNNQTNKAYIYWDIGTPTELIASSRKLEEKSGQFYIFFNEKGKYTVVPNDEIEINFSEGGAREAITDTIIGFGQKIDANTQRFSTIEADIDGLKTTVGEIQNNGNGSSSTVSKIEQRVDKIDLEVKSIQKQYGTDAKLTEMRENFSVSLLSLQATLGLFSSDMNTYMEDNKLTTEEENEINAYKSSLEEKRVGVNTQLDTIKAYLQGLENVDTEKIIKLDTARDELNTSISNLFTNIDTVCVDDVFTNTEITAVVTYFGKVNLEINECKNTIDECIFLGIDGLLIEEISNISLKQDSIKLEVKRVENHTNAELSRIELKQDEITLEVRNEIEGLNSQITQTAEQLTTEFTDEIEGLNSKITQTANSLTTEFTNADKSLQSQITQNVNEITSRVSSVETQMGTAEEAFIGLDTRLNTAEQKITDSAIVSTVTSSTTYKNNLDGKVSTNSIISTINQTAESIKISANKVNLSGYTTFTDLSTSGQTTINADNITTGKIKAITLEGVSIDGKSMIYIREGGILSCDGDTIVKDFYIPETHPGWAAGEVGSFLVEPTARFEHDVWSGGEMYSAGLGVVQRQDGVYIQIKSIGIQRQNNALFMLINCYQNDNVFGVDVWNSDESIKENIVNLKEKNDSVNPRMRSVNANKIGLDLVNSINHYSFNYNEEKGFGNESVDCGYIAQDLQSLNPSLVREVPQQDGKILLEPRASMIIPHLSKAIQEQSEIIKKLESRILELENKISIK